MRRGLAWTTVAPLFGAVVLAVTWGRSLGAVFIVVAATALVSGVLASVHHAEVIAARVGEPFGSLVLAVAVTIIEVGLILTLMAGKGRGAETLARDTVFAAVMITATGVIGVSILVGARAHGTVSFNSEGAGGALAAMLTLAATCLVLPNFTKANRGPEFSDGQLAFAAVASFTLYVVFVLTQTRRHREFFLPPGGESDDDHSSSTSEAVRSAALLLVALVVVVGLAKGLSKPVETAVDRLDLPHAVVGVVIALVILAPETLAAVRAALRDQLQTSLNLAYGSALASVGLTIPALALATPWLDTRLVLGLEPTHITLLAMTSVVNVLTVVPGRATRLQGWIHLVLLATFLYLSVEP